MKGIVITTGGTCCIKDFEQPLYKSIGAVVGGYIEHVKPQRLEEPYCMIVNEEGRIVGLPFNLVGSYLYKTDIHGQPILGDIVIMQDGYYDGAPDIVGIPDDIITQLLADFKTKFNLKED